MHPLLWPHTSAKHKIHWGVVPRPHYAYSRYQAARLAQLLHIPRISGAGVNTRVTRSVSVAGKQR